jgi:putative BNR repeat neuraminidase
MAVDRELGAGAWSYFGDPRAISHDGHTFTGWISTTGNVWVARYTRGGKLSKRLIFRGLGRDDHNNPSLVFRRDGHLMVFFSPHSGHHLPPPGIPSVMRYMVALHRHSIQEFGRVRTVPTNVPGGLGYTYPNPIQLRDKLWLFWRGGGWNPTFSYTDPGSTVRCRTIRAESHLEQGFLPVVRVRV